MNNLPNDDVSVNGHLDVLLAEYRLNIQSLEKSQEYLLQVLTAGVAASAALVSFIISQGISLSPSTAWLLPLILLFFYGLGIYVLHLRLEQFWNARILEIRINLMMPEVSIIRFVPEYPGARFFSSRSGSIKLKWLNTLLAMIAAIFLIALIQICFLPIYKESHLFGTLYLVINSLIIGFELLVLLSLNVDMPSLYYKIMQSVSALKRMPSGDEAKKILDVSRTQNINTFFYIIFPRSWDITAKGPYFWYGFFFAHIAVGVRLDILPKITLLFGSDSNPWSTVSQVPFWAILAFGFIGFVIEELVLQQAKLLWDDIRDQKRDTNLPLNSERAIAKGIIKKNSAIINIVVRLLIAFIIGYFLGGLQVILVFMLILLHQALYVLWAKPRAKQHPVQMLFLLSFNTSLRLIAGIVLIGGFSPIAFFPLSIILTITYFQSLSNSSLLWRVESEHLTKLKLSEHIKPQGEFYVVHGKRLQHYALINIFFITILSYLFYGNYPWFQSIAQYIFLTRINVLLSLLIIIFSGLVSGLIYLVLSLIFNLLSATIFALRKIRRFDLFVKNWVTRFERMLKRFSAFVAILGSVLLLGGGVSMIISLINANILGAMWSYLIHNLGFMLTYENMDYSDYTMVRLKEQISVFMSLLSLYLFTTDSGISLLILFAVLLDYNSALEAKKRIEDNVSSSEK